MSGGLIGTKEEGGGCMQGFINRWKDVFARVMAIPVVFFGIGLYRAWLAIFFRYDAFPTIEFFDYALFEAAIGIACLTLALFARKVAPLWSNRVIMNTTAVLMVGGSALIVIGCFLLPASPLKYAGLVMAGLGLGSLILMWAEFFGSINPMRVALYYAIAIFFGEIIKGLFAGMSAPYLALFSLILPLLSLAWVRASMKRLPEIDLPRKTKGGSTSLFPWKPILLMAVCTFAFGFGAVPMQPLLPGNILGTLAVTALVFFGVLSASKWFNFATIYQLAFPLVTIGFLLVVPSVTRQGEITALCCDAGYTMLSIFITVILSNITYRFGISAAWISGIERGIRYLVEMLGWALFAFVSANFSLQATSGIHTGITAVIVIVFAAIFFTEKGISAKWGINLQALDTHSEESSVSKLSLRVSDLSKKHDLSPREEEVLQLIARKQTAAQIEKDLYVAPGTIKAHVSHIYRKLDVHSRDELYTLLEPPN
ncbi:MAG: helix-turn-helix transcriptional regulator [Raoultibacter sp.]